MGKLRFILTADYEVFGNGSGCVKKCMIDPTEKMLSICDDYGAKLTLFVDVCEYWAFKKAGSEGLLNNKELPHILIEQQLQDAIKRGHDVQLHFHPQWLDAEYENGKWKVKNKYWRLPSVENHPDWNLDKLFKEGKKTLERIIKPVKANYTCNIFRAGAWCIQDEKKILEAMKENGFVADSTVAPNMFFDDGLTFYDFRNSPNKSFWQIQHKVTQEENKSSMKEIPIFTTFTPWYRILYFKLLKVLKRIPFIPTECRRHDSKTKSRRVIFEELFKSQYRMFNFCDATTFQELKYFTKRAERKYSKDKNALVVLIGHPKTFGNEIEFEKFLSWAIKSEKYLFEKYIY